MTDFDDLPWYRRAFVFVLYGVLGIVLLICLALLAVGGRQLERQWYGIEEQGTELQKLQERSKQLEKKGSAP